MRRILSECLGVRGCFFIPLFAGDKTHIMIRKTQFNLDNFSRPDALRRIL